MDKGITLAEYYENSFDVPLAGRDDELMNGETSYHVVQPTFVPVEYSELVKVENLILSRGAIRGKDYLISCHTDRRDLHILALHTTDKFITKDDIDIDDKGEIHVL